MPRYTVVLYPDVEDGGYTVLVPLLPGCITEGDTLDEALANAREAIALHLRGMERDGDDIPQEHAQPWFGTVEVPTPQEAAGAR